MVVDAGTNDAVHYRTPHVRWRLNSFGSFEIFTAIRRALAVMYAGRSEDTNLVGWFSQPLFAGEVRSAS